MPGNRYDFDLYLAERRRFQSNFRITTSLALVPEPSTVLLVAFGLGAFALSRRISGAR